MWNAMSRRDFMRLAGIGGAVFMSGVGRDAGSASLPEEDFYFVQLSDPHWGFEGPPNPDAAGTLPKAVAAVNSLEQPPDFIVFTGDLTHTTDDPQERRRRMAQFRRIVSDLKVPDLHFMPGEHDAALDQGKAFQEFFGATHYSFDHKGVHFIVLDNVSDPAARVGDDQLIWLNSEVTRQAPDTRIVVFTHRPLFDLYPQWDWATQDGARVIDLLLTHPNVTVFYGHIHQEHHHMTGHIAHHSAKSLIFPLPAPGSQLKRTPLPWDSEHPYRGLGFREVKAHSRAESFGITEFALRREV